MPRKRSPEETLRLRLDAEERAGRYLGDANEAKERGNEALAEKLYEKGQFWHDRMNLYLGNR